MTEQHSEVRFAKAREELIARTTGSAQASTRASPTGANPLPTSPLWDTENLLRRNKGRLNFLSAQLARTFRSSALGLPLPEQLDSGSAGRFEGRVSWSP